VAPFRRPGRSVVDEFIEERRREGLKDLEKHRRAQNQPT
jgi:hypothetical protein